MVYPIQHRRSSARLGGPSGPFGGHATLGDVVTYWKQDEESGTRADEVASNDLTDVNTVGYAAGVIGNAASFIEGNSERLIVDSGVGNQVWDVASGSWFFSGWLYLDSAVYTHGRLAGGADTGTNNVNTLFWVAYTTPQIWFYVYNTDGASIVTKHTVAKGFLDAAWNHVVMWMDADMKLHSTLNDNTPEVSTVLAGTIRNARRLGFGDRYHGGAPCTCKWDECGIWERAPTSGEITDLHNGGAGLAY